MNPTVEEAYWRENFKSRPYYREGLSYADTSRLIATDGKRRFARESQPRAGQAEADLQKGWENAMAATYRPWAKTRGATRDAWDRVHGD